MFNFKETRIYILYNIIDKYFFASLHITNPNYTLQLGKRINVYNQYGEKTNPYRLKLCEYIELQNNGNYTYVLKIGDFCVFSDPDNNYIVCIYNDIFENILIQNNIGKKFILKTKNIIYYMDTYDIETLIPAKKKLIKQPLNNLTLMTTIINKLKNNIMNLGINI